jgi:hypothetical protein
VRLADPSTLRAWPCPPGQRPPIERIHRLRDDALTPEELALLGERDPVDPAAALAWLRGEGPDPWRDAESSSARRSAPTLNRLGITLSPSSPDTFEPGGVDAVDRVEVEGEYDHHDSPL